MSDSFGNEEVLGVDAGLAAGPLAEQHPVAGLQIERLDLAALVASSDRNDFALSRLRLAVSGMRTPPLAFSVSMRRTTTRSCKGRNFISSSKRAF
jgi:hypothetical protein